MGVAKQLSLQEQGNHVSRMLNCGVSLSQVSLHKLADAVRTVVRQLRNVRMCQAV